MSNGGGGGERERERLTRFVDIGNSGDCLMAHSGKEQHQKWKNPVAAVGHWQRQHVQRCVT